MHFCPWGNPLNGLFRDAAIGLVMFALIYVLVIAGFGMGAQLGAEIAAMQEREQQIVNCVKSARTADYCEARYGY